MPIYVYKCRNCGKTTELLQRFSDPPAKHCPACSGELVKQFSGQVGLRFNGSGFYITDYVRNKNGQSGKSESSKKPEQATKTG